MRLLTCICIGMLTLTACTDEPRQLPFPELDPSAPFDELQPGGDAPSGASSSSDEFERAIAESMEGDDDEQAEGSVKRQQVPLAAGLVSSVPLEYGEWQWATDGQVTLVVHREAGEGAPDALIYVEDFSKLMRTLPSREMRRFQKTVDPALVRSFSFNPLSEQALREFSEQTGLGRGQVGQLFGRASSHTMGLGLNYRSSEESFTGWQWVGHNDHDVALRLGKTTGRWLPQAASSPAHARQFWDAANEFEAFEGIAQRYADARERQRAAERTDAPAWMLLGSATTGQNNGAHIAIMCKASPNCPVARELSEFIADLHPGAGSTIAGLRAESGPADLQRLADDLALPFAPSDDLVAPNDLELE